MGKKEITAKDECIKICQTIWSCKNPEQKQACYNMFETYKKKHGDENVGVTFIEIELARLEKLIEQMEIRRKQMAKTQEALKKNQIQSGVPLTKEQEKQVKAGNVIPLNAKDIKKK